MNRQIPRAAGSIMLGLMVAAGVRGQEGSSRPEGPEHFRWSATKAHELNHDQTIQSARRLTADQKRKLTDAVLRQLKGNKSLSEFFVGMPEAKVRELAANTRVELVDLNGDGRPEVIAQGNGLGPCGGTGNCIVWIFQMTAAGPPRLLLDSFQNEAGFQVVTIRPWTTNGFKDIVLGAHMNDTDRNLVWYKYGNGSYRRKACYFAHAESEERLNDPDISPRDCGEMFTAGK